MRRRGTAAILATALVGVGGFAAIATGKTTGKGARDSGTSYVSIVHTAGKNTQYAAGYSFDKRFGQTAVTYVTSAAAGTTGTIKITVHRVVEYTKTGELYGTAQAVQSLSTGDVTGGKLDLNHGTGGQKGHSFVGTFTGTFDSQSAIYTFHYKGTYK